MIPWPEPPYEPRADEVKGPITDDECMDVHFFLEQWDRDLVTLLYPFNEPS